MTPAKFNTVIFDLDGTLVDSLTDIAEAANRALTGMGYPSHPKDRYRHFVGDGLITLAERMVPQGTGEDKIIETAERFKTHYRDNWDATTRPYPGILSMLATLANNKLNLSVLSNKPDDFTRNFVNTFFPGVPFGLVFGNREQVPKKPNPQGALEIAALLGTAPHFCLFIGDTSIDISTAKSAGMTSMGVTWGFRGRQELERACADIIIDRPEEIISYVFNDR